MHTERKFNEKKITILLLLISETSKIEQILVVYVFKTTLTIKIVPPHLSTGMMFTSLSPSPPDNTTAINPSPAIDVISRK